MTRKGRRVLEKPRSSAFPLRSASYGVQGTTGCYDFVRLPAEHPENTSEFIADYGMSPDAVEILQELARKAVQ